ncbi:DNA polymerase-3 subunit beta [Microbacterium endophyticum]|uniref:Beta sliding clamp n=1 Tax=Microbacterium endophyticum TaxID=1526412 RepID=A0A7W4V489_9MICO|nr:DNA polymerase III subunit beta [Microbacterium endophyticum]MBB2976530.1 DNA polymerase-3 subunit beta [Microbacterium endophyticum]NIK35976.1 DNA polymerase-3 subunit beta [Microbacterium endophyticum]
MRFQVNRDVFSDAVSFVVKLLPQRNPQPILAGVLIEAGSNGLSLAAFDYEASARTTIDATVDEPGTILVHGRLLSDIANRLPNAPIEVATGDDGIVLTCGSARFTLSSMPVQEYPAIPDVAAETGVVPAEDFATAISQVAFAASRDDVTPVLTGVQLEVTGNRLSLVATDRYRVALREIPWDGPASDENSTMTALVPARTLQEVGKTFAHGGNISISFSGAGDREIIAFTSANKTVTSLLIKGNFPPVRRLFPEQTEHHAVVNTAELAEAVRRVSLVLDRAAPLRFTFTPESVSMDAAGTEQARATESVDSTLIGEDVTLGLNPQYLLESLSAVRSEFARVTFTSSDNANKLSPVLVTPQTSVDKSGEDTFKYLLQPNLLLR